ncbi:hypothetical protein BH09ACT12_BH09ACT12_28510 [soil metagenome]
MRTHISATLGAALLVLALTSCSEDPEPIIDSTPTTPTPTASDPPDSPTPTSSPPAEPESAKAFIRRWQDEAFAMQLSGDTSNYRSMALHCESCEGLADSVADIYGDGGSIRVRGDHVVSDLKRVGKVKKVLIFEYMLSSPSSQVLAPSGKVDQSFVGGTNRYQVNITRKSEGWRISSASRISA